MEHDPWITLAMAVIYQAAMDAHLEHPALAKEAEMWLKYTGVSWCQIMDIQEDDLESWMNNDFILPDNPRRNWRY